MITIKDMKIGESAKIKKINSTGPLKKKLMDMGLTKNTDVLVRKVAPLGDPIEISVRGYELSIRKADAEMIIVE